MLTKEITIKEIKKIFDNKDRKIDYLSRMFNHIDCNNCLPKSNNKIDEFIIKTWKYETSKTILREMFFMSKKYLDGLNCRDEISFLIKDWQEKRLGEIEWPFAAMNFDRYIAKINRQSNLAEEDKDNIVSNAVIKFRRIKDINTKRNDYIESLIIKHNENIVPTFKHSRGVDFYINGEPFDQKVSRGVGKAFEEKFGNNYHNTAISNPELVAISLYENQDEERFDANPRLYVVYMNSDISGGSIEQSIIEANLSNPIQISFSYKHSNNRLIEHNTHCYVIILHN